MSHTYAHLAEFRAFLSDTAAGGNDAVLLSILESASRRVDAFCDRSRFGSGFGPRIGTNTYDHDGSDVLPLDDDVLGLTSVAFLDGTGGASTTLDEDTDFYLRPYAVSPKRELVISGLGEAASSGLKVATAAGTFGYSNTTASLGTAGTVSASATTLVVTGGTPYPGMTLLLDTEQVYVVAATGGTATIRRAQNGTTAAAHADNSAVSYYLYPAEVVAATLLVAQRRWRQRESGLFGDQGGGAHIPVVAARDTERSVLNATVGHLRVYGAG